MVGTKEELAWAVCETTVKEFTSTTDEVALHCPGEDAVVRTAWPWVEVIFVL